MRTARAAALALPLVLAAGCASGAAPAGDDAPQIGRRSGDELLAAGDFDGAVAAYEREGGTSEVAREKLLNARTRAASFHASRALRAADADDVQTAENELARAESLAPGLPVVRTARESIETRLASARRAAELRSRAREVLASDPDEAARLLAEAQSAAPEASDASVDIARLRREATLRAEADRSAERAEAAWAAGDRGRTLTELGGAEFGGRPVAKAVALRKRIETDLLATPAGAAEDELRAAHEFALDAALSPYVRETLRDRLVDRLLASAADLADTRRAATAALLETEAKRLRSDVRTPALDRIRESATTTILVRPFDDGTGGRVDGMRLARAVRERVNLDAAGGGQALRALDDADEARAAYPAALVLTGRVLTARETDGRTGRENRTIRYRSGTRRRPNPEFDAVAAKLDAAALDVRRRDEEKQNALVTLNALKGLAFQRGDGTPRLGDVEVQTRLATAQARVDRADLALTKAKDAEFALRQQAMTIPKDLEEPVWAEHTYEVTNSTRTAQITAHVDLASPQGLLFSDDVSAAAVHKETAAAGFPPAGLELDPDDTPDTATMAALAIDRFAAAAAGSVRTAAGTAALRHLVAAREAERAGERDAAAEGYALYLLATPETATPERADAARALRELLGVHVSLRTTPRRGER